MLQNTNDKDYRSLPTPYSQQTLKLLDKNWKSFFKSVKDYSKNKNKYNGAPKPPKYKHKKRGRFIAIFPINGISKKYLGKKIKRGLFETKEGLLINADVNASINILRKVSTNCNGNIANVVKDLRFSPVRINVR